jgi:apolipoprotein N-acyltransferase
MKMPTKLNNLDYLWLVLGIVLSFFANGRAVISLAVWLAPVFLLRFTRTKHSKSRLALVLMLLIPCAMFNWNGVVPGSLWLLFQITALVSLVLSLCYVCDWFITPKMVSHGSLGVLLSTLILPFSYTSFEFLLALVNPYGTFTVLAYTQWNNLELLQIVSITGIWGISFIIYWFAAIVNRIWELDFTLPDFKRPTAHLEIKIFSIILLTILLFGGARVGTLAMTQSMYDPQVRIGTITRTELNGEVWDAYNAELTNHPTDFENRNWTTTSMLSEALADQYLEQSELCIELGSKFIFLQEAGLPLMNFDEASLVSKFANFSDVHFGVAMMVMPTDKPDYYTATTVQPYNKLVVVGPDGTIVGEHIKHNAIPGVEIIETDNSPLEIIDTPYGKVAFLICFDMDHHELPLEASEADIIFAVSNDWPAMDPLHTQMASVTGIANGYSVIRPTGRGLSVASDYRGVIASQVDVYPFDMDGNMVPDEEFQNEGTIMIANVPVHGVTTVYSILGDYFGWLCVLGLGFLVIIVLLNQKLGFKFLN